MHAEDPFGGVEVQYLAGRWYVVTAGFTSGEPHGGQAHSTPDGVNRAADASKEAARPTHACAAELHSACCMLHSSGPSMRMFQFARLAFAVASMLQPQAPTVSPVIGCHTGCSGNDTKMWGTIPPWCSVGPAEAVPPAGTTRSACDSRLFGRCLSLGALLFALVRGTCGPWRGPGLGRSKVASAQPQ